jgi:hypothetical protein
MDMHTWITPEALAVQLDATRYHDGWRAKCPVHGGDNPAALSIKRGTDKHGNPCTLLYCFAHQCDILDICEALGLTLVSLFCIHPEYAKATRRQPRSHDPRLERLRFWKTPHSRDDLAQAMLESEIVNDAGFLGRCPPARETFWQLAQEPGRKLALVKALADAKLPVQPTLDALRHEWESA